MNVFYWSPHIDQVATVKAVINSAYALNLYSNKRYVPHIINVAGEWDQYLEELNEKKIELINLTKSKAIKNKNFKGFYKSRIIYFYIFILAFFPLLKLLKKERPEYLIAHLITPLPLIINYLFKLKTKFILRISGLPKLKNLRLFIWKITLKKIYLITCPTLATKEFISQSGIINHDKVALLYDPALSPRLIQKKKKLPLKDFNLENFYLAIGRLTKQKNFLFLIKSFYQFNKDKKNKLVIIGEGEERNKLEKFIEKHNLNKTIYLKGYQKNVFNYFKMSKCFILSSLWEDPGFVILEAGFSNKFVISSDCKNGPKEILDDGKNGILFKSNDQVSLIQALEKFEKLTKKEKFQYKLNLKRKIKNFSLLSHYKELNKLLSSLYNFY